MVHNTFDTKGSGAGCSGAFAPFGLELMAALIWNTITYFPNLAFKCVAKYHMKSRPGIKIFSRSFFHFGKQKFELLQFSLESAWEVRNPSNVSSGKCCRSVQSWCRPYRKQMEKIFFLIKSHIVETMGFGPFKIPTKLSKETTVII